MVKRAILLVVLGLIVTALLWSCGSESPETQALYTDAKEMYNQINAAFRLPGNSPERKAAMIEIIKDSTDLKVVRNLEQYLNDAPDGKFSKEAQNLLDQVRQNTSIRMLGQLRPLMEQTGGETPEEQLDSLSKIKPGVEKDS